MGSDESSSPLRFFVLKKMNGGHHDTEASTVNLRTGPAPRCPQCGDFNGMLTWQPPYQIELELYGKDYGDFIRTHGGDWLVTESFAEDFKAEGLTGLSGFHPVEVTRVRRGRRGPKPGPPPRYLLVNLAYGNTALDMERSRLSISTPVKCTWCRYADIDAIDGLYLEEGTWSGEDIFRPRGLWGVIHVSERFMRFAERHAMSNMALIPMEKYVWDPLGHFYPHELQVEPPNKS